ncbi:hypothetical protein BJV82DRAFT_610334 [Fennellomyces sp. T-0311]|nr:hypothetical protein BJV82DRAFT_610334 [Fennellomyces sp. T-0311]
MKQFGILAVSTVLATAINGLFVPRQDQEGSLSDFHGEWYNVGITSNVDAMLDKLDDQYGIRCYCPRTTIQGHDNDSERADFTSTCDLRNGTDSIGEFTSESYVEYERRDGDRYTLEYHQGEVTVRPEDDPQNEKPLPNGMPDDDFEVYSEFLSTNNDDNHNAIVFWGTYHDQTYGSLYYRESSIDDNTFNHLVEQISDSSAKDNMVRVEEGCD